MRPGLPHGTKYHYNLGCRCVECRAANAAYTRERKRRGPNLVDAAPVRRHLRRLARAGIGFRAVAAASDTSWSTVQGVRGGKIRRVRPETAARLLDVDEGARADESRVSSRRTRAAIRRMSQLGLTHREIAERLGLQRKGVDYLIKGLVFARNELRVLRLLRQVEAEVELERELPTVCLDCGLSHAPADRHARLRRLEEPVYFADVRDAYPCVYSDDDNGRRTFERDKAAIGMRIFRRGKRAA